MVMATVVKGKLRGENGKDIPQECRVGDSPKNLREAPYPIHGGARGAALPGRGTGNNGRKEESGRASNFVYLQTGPTNLVCVTTLAVFTD
jgi:hypothetical protein